MVEGLCLFTNSGIIQFCQDILLYGFSTFLPSILTSMGYDKLEANYLSIPVYIWGALAFVGVARISDKYKARGIVSACHKHPSVYCLTQNRLSFARILLGLLDIFSF